MVSPSSESGVAKRGRGRPPRRSVDVSGHLLAGVEIKTEPEDELEFGTSTPTDEKKSLTLPAAVKSENHSLAAKNVPHLAPVQLNVPEEPKGTNHSI